MTGAGGGTGVREMEVFVDVEGAVGLAAGDDSDASCSESV